MARVYDREESIERRHTVYQMYAESNVTSCICHKLGICTLTNPSSVPTFDTLSLPYTLANGGEHHVSAFNVTINDL